MSEYGTELLKRQLAGEQFGGIVGQKFNTNDAEEVARRFELKHADESYACEIGLDRISMSLCCACFDWLRAALTIGS